MKTATVSMMNDRGNGHAKRRLEEMLRQQAEQNDRLLEFDAVLVDRAGDEETLRTGMTEDEAREFSRSLNAMLGASQFRAYARLRWPLSSIES